MLAVVERVGYIALQEGSWHSGLQSEVPFRKLMCANRGEIAIRVFRAGTELALRTVRLHLPPGAHEPAVCQGS
jgi:pyruvate carboxylase